LRIGSSLFGARQRLGLLEGLFAGELFRPKAPVRIVLEVLARPPVRKPRFEAAALRHASCLIRRTLVIPSGSLLRCPMIPLIGPPRKRLELGPPARLTASRSRLHLWFLISSPPGLAGPAAHETSAILRPRRRVPTVSPGEFHTPSRNPCRVNMSWLGASLDRVAQLLHCEFSDFTND
jgi:hypothetical protein